MQEASSKTCEWLVDRRAGINAAGAWYFGARANGGKHLVRYVENPAAYEMRLSIRLDKLVWSPCRLNLPSFCEAVS
jgi:hypothetical protein